MVDLDDSKKERRKKNTTDCHGNRIAIATFFFSSISCKIAISTYFFQRKGRVKNVGIYLPRTKKEANTKIDSFIKPRGSMYHNRTVCHLVHLVYSQSKFYSERFSFYQQRLQSVREVLPSRILQL